MRIIESLQANGRESFRNIAGQLGVSEGTVRNRYGRLVSSNVLQVTGITNPLGLGYAATAMVGVTITGSATTLADEIAAWEEATYVVVSAGRFDLLVEFVCVDHAHLLALVERLRGLAGVASTESFMYLELHKQLYNWGPRRQPESPDDINGS